jgi:hypothetical protein
MPVGELPPAHEGPPAEVLHTTTHQRAALVVSSADGAAGQDGSSGGNFTQEVAQEVAQVAQELDPRSAPNPSELFLAP